MTKKDERTTGSDDERSPRVARPPVDEKDRLAAIARLEAFFAEGPARGRARRFCRDGMHER